MYAVNKIETFRMACRCRHGPSRVLFIFCLLLATNAALPSAALADGQISVEPGTTVQVGEEVFFDGTGVTVPGAELLPNGMIKGLYEWDFGDDYTLMDGYPYPYYPWTGGYGGTVVSHYYMRHGTYTVTLNVTSVNGKTKTETTTIIVEGEDPKLSPRPSIEPILELKFENNLVDTSANGLTAQWQNGIGSFVKGIEGKAADLTSGSYIEVLDPTGILGGMDEFTISLWAKKKDADTTAYLLYKNGAYDLQLSGVRTVYGNIKTESGTKRVQNFNANEITNKMWHQYVITYNGSSARLFTNLEGTTPLELTGPVLQSVNSLFLGKATGNVFNGYIDEIKIYNKALTPKELFVGFELWHADFHAHISQYIYAQIPGVFTKDSTNKIKVTVTGDTGFSKEVYNKNNLQSEEKFLLNNSELPAGNYTITVQLLTATNNILDEIKEKFEKPYDGIPKVGIDENNAIRVNEELFFPVTSWGLTKGNMMDNWDARKCINTLYGEGYYPVHDDDSWKDYLDQGTAYSWPVMGRADMKNIPPNPYRSNLNINAITNLADETKDHPALMMWDLGDEPGLHWLSSPVLRAETYKYHKLDPKHLVVVNYWGGLWSGLGEGKGKSYGYFYNAKYFGGKRTHVADVVGFDYYSIGFREGGTTVEKLAVALDTIKERHYNLVPYMSFVETAYLVTTLPPPTAEQLRMLTWLSVVHGVKGINWYPFEPPTPPENFAVMTEFKDHITRLTPIVLGPETDRVVTDDANEPGNRVDTMIREDEENIYIFAVRLTEVTEPQVDDNITVTFTVDGLTSDMTIIEPAEFSQSILEYQGDSNLTQTRNTFSFSLNNAPIIQGTVQVAGQYREIERGRDDRIYLYDDGNGNLYGVPISWQYKDMSGTVNYETGEVYIDFGVDGIGDDILILLGEDKVRSIYRPVKNDRTIPHTGNTFTDTFAPNAVHIYRISLSDQGTNNTPVLASIGNKSVSENSSLSFSVSATDADSNTILYSATGLPTGATFTGQTFSWTPGYTQAGTYQVTFTASDGTASDSETITITVSNINRTPVLASIGDKSVNENSTLSFSVSATDADGDTITYSVQSLPSGAVFASQTFTWTPGYTQAGTHQVTFTASDGTALDSETITITVNNVNRVPVLDSIGDKSVFTENSLTFTISATDADSDTITYSATNLPSGATFSGQNFSWTPGSSQAGSYDVTFTASDSQVQNSETITITVVPDTAAPTVTNLSPQEDSIQVSLNSLILLDVTDTGKGVDAATVTIEVNGNLVYTGNATNYNSSYGKCRRIGNIAAYKYIYQPNEKFDFDQAVTVTVNAADLASTANTMSEYSYSFKSQMRSFGENKILSSGSSNDNWGPLTTVSDGSGNIWVAWPQGVVGDRDIFLGKLIVDEDSFETDTIIQVTNDIPDQGSPVIAVDSFNKLYLAWQDNRQGEWDIYISTSDDWSIQTKITDPNSDQINPAIAIDNLGKVYIAWEDDPNGNKDIYIASSTNNFVSKTTSRITSNTYDQTTPAIAIDSDDTVYVVWTDQRNVGGGKNPKPQNDIFGAASNDFWANIPIVTKEESQSNPKIATEAAGTVLHLVWIDDTPGDDDIYYANTSGGLPSSPLTGSSIIDDLTGTDQLSPVIATTGSTGNGLEVFACWRDERNTEAELYAAEITANGTNIYVGNDFTTDDQSQPAIGIDQYDHPYLVWINGRTDICYAGSTFIEPTALTSAAAPVSTTITVGTAIASIADEDDASVVIPAGAYVCDIDVIISRIRNPQKLPANNRTFLYEFGPSGTTFSEPVTITIPYNAETLVKSPSAYWYNPLTGLYSQEGITDVEVIQISSGLYALRFNTTHFSGFSGGGPFGGVGGGGGGGCSVSPHSRGSIVEFLLPYIGLTAVMIVLKLRDRRNKKARNITESEC